MKYELPTAIKENLATREVRLHHYLWHGIRDNWHRFTDAHKQALKDRAPEGIPKHARFITTGPGEGDIEVNYEGGESFLYMHRNMIQSVNLQLAAIDQPAIIPWENIPSLDDPDYPIPGGITNDGDEYNPKTDANLALMQSIVRADLSPEALANEGMSLSQMGALIESFIHDFMHMRWADVDPGVMQNFPNPNPLDLNPVIDEQFNTISSDYLGHPYSSHVNSAFWILHGWIGAYIEKWLKAKGLTEVQWSDTWEGLRPAPPNMVLATNKNLGERLLAIHDHAHHNHGSWEKLLQVFKLINSFEDCHIGFDYISKARIKPKIFLTSPQ